MIELLRIVTLGPKIATGLAEVPSPGTTSHVFPDGRRHRLSLLLDFKGTSLIGFFSFPLEQWHDLFSFGAHLIG